MLFKHFKNKAKKIITSKIRAAQRFVSKNRKA